MPEIVEDGPIGLWVRILNHSFDRDPELARELSKTGYVAWGLWTLQVVASDRSRTTGDAQIATVWLADLGLRAVKDGVLSMGRLREIDPLTLRIPEGLEEWVDAFVHLAALPTVQGAPQEVPEA